ncbi:UNVERIFIED_CONTAM: OmpA family protein, partial [Bacteroidetes bacterium 56_B9]
ADREIKLSGDALYAAAADQIRAALANELPPGWKATADISVRPAATPVDTSVCQQLFTDLFAKGKIRFDTGSATIDRD